jgi:hypothetical protein
MGLSSAACKSKGRKKRKKQKKKKREREREREKQKGENIRNGDGRFNQGDTRKEPERVLGGRDSHLTHRAATVKSTTRQRWKM